jgi:hypothetical protein
MHERRAEARFLCADLVAVEWQDASGKTQRIEAILEDISPSGACLQCDRSIPPETALHVLHPAGRLDGAVKYCLYRDIGYFIGMAFDPGHGWSASDFSPDHLLDLSQLMERGIDRSRRRKPN